MQARLVIGRARRWLPVTAAIAMLGLIAIYFATAVRDTQQAHRSAEEARLQDTARALASAIDAQLGAYVTALRALAAAEFPRDPHGHAEHRRQTLGAAARTLGGVLVLTGPSPDFPILGSFGEDGIEQRPQIRLTSAMSAIRPLMEQAVRERRPVVSDVFQGALTGQQRIAIYVPIVDGDSVTGLLSLGIAPDALQQILDRQGFSGGARSVVVDDRRRIAALTNFPPSYSVGAPVVDLVAEAIQGRDRAVVDGVMNDRSHRTIAIERLAMAPGWYVAVSRLYGELDAVAWHQLRWVQLSGAAFLLMSALIAWMTRRQALRESEARAAALQAGRDEIERLHAGLPAMIFMREVATDGTSRIVYRSGDIEAVTGWPTNEVARVATLAAKGTLTAEGEVCFLRDVLRDGSGMIEYLLDRPVGAPHWVRATVRVIEHRPNGSALVVGYLINVNDEVVARNAARHARNELERTLSHAPIAVYRGLIAPDGAIRPLYRSPGFLPVTGWDPRSAAGRDIFSVLVPDGPDIRRRSIVSLRQSGEMRADIEMQRPDGTLFWGRVHSRVLDRAADGTMEVIGYIQDVTQERLAEQSARRVQRLASLGEFSSGVAHELRQPLATMLMAAENAQYALECDDKADADARLATIIAQVERATALIEHLRQFARGSSGQEQVEVVDVDAGIAGAVGLLGRSLDANQITLDIAPPAHGLQVLANRISLEQVIVNLLSNARDALGELPPGAARRIALACSADHDAGTLTLTVTDTGPGIPADVLPRLFEPFVTSKGPDKGTGIGLSICFGLMRSMGGMMEGANGADGGAVFTLTFRLGATSEQAGTSGGPVQAVAA